MPNNVNQNSRVFFYFSGRGSFDPKTGEASLLPWDGDGAVPATGYALKKLFESLNKLGAKQAIAILDVGFYGEGERSSVPGTLPPGRKINLAGEALGEADLRLR